MRTKVLLQLLKKEFLNIIRDRKSFIFMILLPLLMFPLMLGIITVMVTSMTEVSTDNIKLGVNYEISDEFKKYADDFSDDFDFEFIYDTEKNLNNQFVEGDLSIYVIKEGTTYNIHFDENNTADMASSVQVTDLYANYKEVYIGELLEEKNIDYEALKNEFNIEFIQENVTEMGSLIPVILSMVLTLLITSTAFNVAIEITTSEKEKGTLETILSLPIRKRELIASKYLTTVILSIMSGLLTYISLFTTLYFGKNTLSMLGITALSISPKILIIYLVAIVLFAVFISGLILSLAIFSRSLKEAQNSLAPIEMLMAIISYLPMLGFEASIKSAIIPFVNISLLFNNALATNLDSSFIILTFLSTIAYAMILMLIISKLYNEEDVLFNSSNLKNMVFTKGKSRMVAFTPFTSIILLVVIYLLGFYFTLIFLSSSKYLIIAMMPITIVFVLLIASLIVKLDYKKAFSFKKFTFKQLLYGFALFIGARIITTNILNIVINIFPSLVEDINIVNNVLSVDNIWLGILLIGILPAVTEELLFRGVVQNSFIRKYSPAVGIIVSSIIFGIYHMNWLQGINAVLIGLALGYLYYKTKSLWITMLFHFGNNALSVIIDKFKILQFSYPLGINISLSILSVILICLTVYIFQKELRN